MYEPSGEPFSISVLSVSDTAHLGVAQGSCESLIHRPHHRHSQSLFFLMALPLLASSVLALCVTGEPVASRSCIVGQSLCHWVSDHAASFHTNQSNCFQLNLLLHPMKVSHRVLNLHSVLSRVLCNLNRGLIVLTELHRPILLKT